MSKKIVTVYSTKGQKMTKVETEATTWGELKKDFIDKGIQFEGMQAVINETKTILKLDGAVLPKGLSVGDKVTDDFVLFLSPSKQVAGSSYAELKSYVKSQRMKSGAAVMFFGDYTHMTKESLEKAVTEWKEKNKKPSTKVVACNSEGIVPKPTNVNILSEVFNLVSKAVELLSTLPGVTETSEYEKLKEQANAVEFELLNSN